MKTSNTATLAQVHVLNIEIQQLQKALSFWLPHRPNVELTKDLEARLEHDIGLLAGYMGHMGKDAEQLGWITLNYAPAVTDQP